MKTRFVALSSLAFLLLTGCAGFNSSKHDQNAAFASEDLDELLHFGSDMANMAESSRAEVCQALLNRQKEAPSVGVQLHLMAGRMLSDACGDINTILAGAADGTLMKNLSDERVRWLAAAQTEALKRMGDQSRKLAVLERRPKTAPSASYPKKRKPESYRKVPKPRKGIPSQKYRAEPQKAVPEPKEEGTEPQTGLPEPQPETPKGNPGLLQNKLDAIRSLENKLDRPGEGN